MGSTGEILYLKDVKVDENNVSPGAEKILLLIRPQWNKDKIKYKYFTDGISNKLFGCYLEDDSKWNDMILIRVYGANTEQLIDRELEIQMITLLNAAGHAPPIYASFSNGLCYGFVQGCCPNAETIRSEPIWRLIAEKMAQLHAIEPENYPVDFKLDREPSVFKKAQKWMKIIPTSFEDPEKNKKLHDEIPSKEELQREIDMLQNHLENLDSPVVLCHNDLLINNVVYNKEKGTVHFIDFEYGGFCYEAHDIGNHFAEFAGVDEVDYSRYPDKEFQLKWLRVFLESKYKIQGKDPSSVTDLDVERLYVQANKFALASGFMSALWCLAYSHLSDIDFDYLDTLQTVQKAYDAYVLQAAHFYWGVWALIQSSISKINFDYLSYAVLRLNEYFARRDVFLALEMP